VLIILVFSVKKLIMSHSIHSICTADDEFVFSNLSLSHPISLQGGAYLTKISYDTNPLYIETPKCLTKQGFIKSGKKIYTELMFDQSDEKFIRWLENLENTCHQLIYEKGESWFQNKLELDDIETAFTSPLRVYKSGKYYLVRVNVKINFSTNCPYVKIYNENETPLTIEDVTPETQLISIVEIQGIRFTSKNFQIEMELKQSMVLNSEKIFEQCLIKTNKQKIDSAISATKTSILGECNEVVQKNDNLTQMDTSMVDLEKMCESILSQEESSTTETATNPESFVSLEESNVKNVVSNELQEFQPSQDLNDLETITLKKPNQVYYEIYKEARKKAKTAKREAIIAFLKAKNIKKTYILDDLDESDEDDLDNLSDYSESELENKITDSLE